MAAVFPVAHVPTDISQSYPPNFYTLPPISSIALPICVCVWTGVYQELSDLFLAVIRFCHSPERCLCILPLHVGTIH